MEFSLAKDERAGKSVASTEVTLVTFCRLGGQVRES